MRIDVQHEWTDAAGTSQRIAAWEERGRCVLEGQFFDVQAEEWVAWDDPVREAAELASRAEAAEARLAEAENERDVLNGRACAEEVEAGNGPCGVCVRCLRAPLLPAEVEGEPFRVEEREGFASVVAWTGDEIEVWDSGKSGSGISVATRLARMLNRLWAAPPAAPSEAPGLFTDAHAVASRMVRHRYASAVGAAPPEAPPLPAEVQAVREAAERWASWAGGTVSLEAPLRVRRELYDTVFALRVSRVLQRDDGYDEAVEDERERQRDIAERHRLKQEEEAERQEVARASRQQKGESDG